MVKLEVSVVNYFAFLFLSGVDFSSALNDNVFADAYSSRGGGIYRGEASSSISERGDQLSEAAQSSGSAIGDANIVGLAEPASCAQDTERLLNMNENIRLELSAIDIQYLENASIQNVCKRDGKISNCNFDFRLFPNELQMVCENYGGNFDETEHSIQCHDPNTKESLYYQFDHYPSCFSVACEKTDGKQFVAKRIDSITQALSEYLGMACFADDDILRYANDASSIAIESSGIKSSLHGIQMFPVAALLMMLHFN